MFRRSNICSGNYIFNCILQQINENKWSHPYLFHVFRMWQCERKYVVMIITLLHHDVTVAHFFQKCSRCHKTVKRYNKKIKNTLSTTTNQPLSRLQTRLTQARCPFCNHRMCYSNINNTPADITNKHKVHPSLSNRATWHRSMYTTWCC